MVEPLVQPKEKAENKEKDNQKEPLNKEPSKLVKVLKIRLQKVAKRRNLKEVDVAEYKKIHQSIHIYHEIDLYKAEYTVDYI
jgi:hypothetical protein